MKTILIVDDDAGSRTDLAAALADDYAVRCACNARQAIDFLQQNRVDLVLLETGMNGCDGYVVLSHACGMQPRPLVVALTALGQITKAVRAVQLGANEYLLKGCDLGAVRGVVQKLFCR
jgi:DNA-binding NtrC family response regulator